MRKSDFYLRYKNDFHKVTGYIEIVTDQENNKYVIGFHNEGKYGWGATHVENGLLICRGDTRKECLEKVKSEKVLSILKEYSETTKFKKSIDEMNEFLKEKPL